MAGRASRRDLQPRNGELPENLHARRRWRGRLLCVIQVSEHQKMDNASEVRRPSVFSLTAGSPLLSDFQADRPHEREGIALLHYARAELIVEDDFSVLQPILEMHVHRL